MSLSKYKAAERAHQVLRDGASEYPLARICTCQVEAAATTSQIDSVAEETAEDEEDATEVLAQVGSLDETEEGFASRGQAAVAVYSDEPVPQPDGTTEDPDEIEVEEGLLVHDEEMELS